MFERRPVWAVLIGLTVCISIWRISVQEPSMLAEYGYDSNVVGAVGNIPPNAASAAAATSIVHQHQFPLYGGKHLLNRKMKLIDEEIRHNKLIASRRIKAGIFTASSPSQELIYPRGRSSRNDSTKLSQTTINSYGAHSDKISGKRSIEVLSSKKTEKSPIEKPTDIIKSRIVSATQWISINRTSNTFTQPSPQGLAPTIEMHQVATSISTSTTEALQFHLPADDFQQLIDLNDFDFIMPQPACTAKIAALILVHSAPQNFKKRLLLRETWAQSNLLQGTPLRLIFLLGAVTNGTLQQRLRQENDEFADMVQGNFMDDYKNMTYKHAMAFKWFIYNCAGAQILLKVDDDVFVNTIQLLRYIHSSPTETMATGEQPAAIEYNKNSSKAGGDFPLSQVLFNHPQRLLFCQPMLGARVKRSYRSKWRVSVHEFRNRYYPPYCPGYSIIYSPDVVLRLYTSLQASKYFWIDDVHVTGTLAQLNNITITSSMPYVLSSDTCDEVIAGKTNLGQLEFLFAWPGITELQIRSLWKLARPHYENSVVKYHHKPTSPLHGNTVTEATVMRYRYRGIR